MDVKYGHNQRKQPCQERSRRTVERIVDASGHVLAAHGYSGCSTNLIAAEAGVNKASLYQYFAGKDEILTALARSMADGLMDELGAAIDGYLGADISTLVEGLLSVAFDAVERRRHILRPLLLDAPHIDVLGMLTAVEIRAADVARAYITLNPNHFRADIDPGATIFVTFSAVRASMTDYATGATDLSRERIAPALLSIIDPALAR